MTLLSAPTIISERQFDNEARVLSAVLFIDGEAARIAANIGPRVLFRDSFRAAAFSAAKREIERSGVVDWSIVGQRLIESGDFSAKTVGDEMTALSELSVVAHRLAVDVALRELHEQQDSIDLGRVCSEVASGGMPTAEARLRLGEIIDTTARSNSGRLTTLADAMTTDPAEEIGELIPTGISGFDYILPDNALHPGDKLALAGKPGSGKTAFAMTIAVSSLIANRELRAVWALGEMSIKALRNRSLQTLSGLTIGVLRRDWADLSPLQHEAKRQAVDMLRDIGKRLTILDPPLTPGRIENAVAHTGAKLLVVDYLQLCRLDRDAQSRRDEIDGVVRALTSLANRRGVASLWLSSMPKGALASPDVYACFKESAEIAHACDLAYFIDTGSDDDDANADSLDVVPLYLRCLKARHGSPLSAHLQFDRAAQRFTFGKAGTYAR